MKYIIHTVLTCTYLYIRIVFLTGKPSILRFHLYSSLFYRIHFIVHIIILLEGLDIAFCFV